MNVGDTAMVRKECKLYGRRYNNMVGHILSIDTTYTNPICVYFEGISNGISTYNSFAFQEDDLWLIRGEIKKKEDPTMFKHNSLSIKNVYFNDPVTVVMWNDGTKTIVRCSENDFYDPEKGLAMAIIKKFYGNDNSFHKIFKKWLPKEDDDGPVDSEDFFANLRRILLGKE